MSEVFAADGFYRHGIPYHYECAVPLMIAPEQVRTWIRDPAAAQEMLREPLPQLKAKRDYEQLSLF